MRRLVVGAAIVRDGRLLAQQRAWPADHAGRWELPGGRVEPGEPPTAAVVRECLEELGVAVEPGRQVGADVPLPGGRWTLRVYAAAIPDPLATPRAVEHAALRWLTAAELQDIDWLDADRALIPDLRALLPPGPLIASSGRTRCVERNWSRHFR